MHPIIYSVKEFNELLNTVLSQEIGEVTISGEISGYQVRQNKWVSFDLKDDSSCLNCFCSLYQLDFPLEDGQAVLVTGTPRVYIPYGKLSLTVTHVQIQGEGAIKKAFDALKVKLELEGLFAPEHKRPLPRFPESVGIITSGEGAAVNDILKVINGRWGGVTLYLVPVLVQGKNAPDELVGALNYFNQHYPVDVIIFGRGGGSLEDLQAFNSERVARAIFSSKIPIISGIGHEHNTCIADLVADIRAATPSNAAEIAIPDRKAVAHVITLLKERARENVRKKIIRNQQLLDHNTQSLQLQVTARLGQVRLLIEQLYQRLKARLIQIKQYTVNLNNLHDKANVMMKNHIHQARQSLQDTQKLLEVLSPNAVLARGYSITFSKDSHKPITCLAEVPPSGTIVTQVRDGQFESNIPAQPNKAILSIRPTPVKPKLTQPSPTRSIINSAEQSTLF